MCNYIFTKISSYKSFLVLLLPMSCFRGTSSFSQMSCSSFKVYAESKLYLLLIGEYLCSKYPEKRLRFIGYDPGTFSSGIYRMQKKWFQVLYKIAAPFMRSPAKVAKALYQILTNQIRNYDLVYDVSMRTRQIPYSNTAEAGELLNFCEQNLARFLS